MTDVTEWWVSVPEAGRLLNRSERTIRRMATDERLPSRKEGARLYVNVADFAQPPPEPPPDVTVLQHRVEMLQAEVDNLRLLVDQLAGERDFLRGQNTYLLQLQTPAIEQPKPKRRSWWPLWGREED